MRTWLRLLLVATALAAPASSQVPGGDRERPAPPDKGQKADPRPEARPLGAEEKTEVALRIQQLSSPRWGVREKATQRLIDLGRAHREVGPLVALALKESKEAETRWRLRKVLKETGQAALDMEALQESLAEKLGPLGNALYVQWSPRYQDAPEISNHEAAPLFELVKGVGRPAVSVLAQKAKSGNDKLRANIAYLLGQLGSPEAAPALLALLKDANEDVRKLAAWSLGTLRESAAIPPLLELAAKDESRDVRAAAVLSLVPMRRREAVKALIDLLPKGGEAGWLANWVLEKLTGQRTGYNPFREDRRTAGHAAWQAWYARHGQTFEPPPPAGPGPRQKNRLSEAPVPEVKEVLVTEEQKARLELEAKKKREERKLKEKKEAEGK